MCRLGISLKCATKCYTDQSQLKKKTAKGCCEYFMWLRAGCKKSKKKFYSGKRSTYNANDEFIKSLCIFPSGLQ